MCIGNTTSPAANSTVNWYPREEERVTTLQEDPRAIPKSQDMGQPKKDSLKSKPKAQSSRTSGGAY